MVTEPMLLRVVEAAGRLGVSPSTVRRLIDRQGLPFVVVGTEPRVPADALAGWVASHTMTVSEPHPGEPHDPIPRAYVVGQHAYVAKVCAICAQMLDDGRKHA